MQVSPGHRPTSSATSALPGVGVSPSTTAIPALHPAGLTASTSNAAINHSQLDVPVTGNAVAGPSTSPAPVPSARKDKKGVGGPPKSKAYAHPLASRADEVKYRTKFKQLKVKVKEIEEENMSLQAKILKTKRQIQRLRLERMILYDRYEEARNAGMLDGLVPASSLRPQPHSVHGIPLDTSDLMLSANGPSLSLPPQSMEQPFREASLQPFASASQGPYVMLNNEDSDAIMAGLSEHSLDHSLSMDL